jgi:hypothetical protein
LNDIFIVNVVDDLLALPIHQAALLVATVTVVDIVAVQATVAQVAHLVASAAVQMVAFLAVAVDRVASVKVLLVALHLLRMMIDEEDGIQRDVVSLMMDDRPLYY